MRPAVTLYFGPKAVCRVKIKGKIIFYLAPLYDPFAKNYSFVRVLASELPFVPSVPDKAERDAEIFF